MSAPIELESRYYLEHFASLLRIIKQMYRDLLTDTETDFLARFDSLDEPAQCLYVRLCNRRPRFFRTAKLHYSELPPLEELLQTLRNTRLIRAVPADLHRDEWANSALAMLHECFTRNEIIAALNTIEPLKSLTPTRASRLSKTALIEMVTEQIQADHLLGFFAARETVVNVPDKNIVEFFKFLFFGSSRLGMEQFVIRDLGHVKFENIDTQALQRRFHSRQEIDDHLRIHAVSKTFNECREQLTAAEIYLRVAPSLSNRAQFHAATRPNLDRLGYRIGRWLERQSALQEALDCYTFCPNSKAQERRIRLLTKLGEPAAAVRLCRAILRTTEDPAERLFSADYLARYGAKAKHLATTQSLRSASTITLTPARLAHCGGQVELAALDYYHQQGWQGVFCENKFWRSLFGLVLWDELFNPSTGAIHHPMQRAPSDLHQTDFFRTRRPRIEHALKLLDTEQGFAQIRDRVESKWGISNPFVVWEDDLERLISLGWQRLQASQIKAVLREIATNIKSKARGFPDLFLWSAHSEDYQFVEIKSPTDQLRAQQRHWLHFFRHHAINTRIVKVRYCESR